MPGYLNITSLKTALLLKFECARPGIKRVSNWTKNPLRILNFLNAMALGF